MRDFSDKFAAYLFAQSDSRAPSWYDLIGMPEVTEPKRREEARRNRAKVGNIKEALFPEETDNYQN